MSPTLTSQGLVLATAMAVSAGTLVLFDLFRQNLFPQQIPQNHRNPPSHHHPLLKSCLSSGSRNGEKESKKKKKKKVKFADDVKDSKGNGEIYRKERRKSAEIQKKNCCGDEIQKMPANRAALYNGILKDRVHRIQYSH